MKKDLKFFMTLKQTRDIPPDSHCKVVDCHTPPGLGSHTGQWWLRTSSPRDRSSGWRGQPGTSSTSDQRYPGFALYNRYFSCMEATLIGPFCTW